MSVDNIIIDAYGSMIDQREIAMKAFYGGPKMTKPTDRQILRLAVGPHVREETFEIAYDRYNVWRFDGFIAGIRVDQPMERIPVSDGDLFERHGAGGPTTIQLTIQVAGPISNDSQDPVWASQARVPAEEPLCRFCGKRLSGGADLCLCCNAPTKQYLQRYWSDVARKIRKRYGVTIDTPVETRAIKPVERSASGVFTRPKRKPEALTSTTTLGW